MCQKPGCQQVFLPPDCPNLSVPLTVITVLTHVLGLVSTFPPGHYEPLVRPVRVLLSVKATVMQHDPTCSTLPRLASVVSGLELSRGVIREQTLRLHVDVLITVIHRSCARSRSSCGRPVSLRWCEIREIGAVMCE